MRRSSRLPRSVPLVAASAAVVTILAGIAFAVTFSSPKRIGHGWAASAVSDGRNVYVATTGSYDGIYYQTNRSGTWKEKHVLDPANPNVDLFQPSIAVDGKHHVYIAYYQYGGRTPGIQYVTNRTGKWRKHLVTVNSHDVAPDIAVAKGHIFIVFSRGDINHEQDALFLARIGPGGITRSRITPGKGLYQDAEISIRGGKPVIGYVLEQDTTNQHCGVWTYRAGTSTLWTQPPAFPRCSDGNGSPTWTWLGATYSFTAASDGLHFITSQPYQVSSLPDTAAPYWHLYRSNGVVEKRDVPIKDNMFLSDAVGRGDHIYTVWLIQCSDCPSNGTYYLKLNRGPTGWSHGSFYRLSHAPATCGTYCRPDETPAIATTRTRRHVFVSRIDPRPSSPTYEQTFVYWYHT